MLRDTASRIELLVGAFLMLFALGATAYVNLQLKGFVQGTTSAALAALFGIAFALTLDSDRMRSAIHAVSQTRKVWIVAVGLCVHLAVAAITDPTPASNAITYLDLAGRLADGEAYISRQGHRAFYPPGLPLFLAPFVSLFGASLLAVVLANIALFLAGAWAVSSLARSVIDDRAATVALLLYCAWPSRLLSSGLASKENLTLTAAAVGLALVMSAIAGRLPWTAWKAAGAGAFFGFASLAQPGLLLLVLALPAMFRGRLFREDWKGRTALLLAGLALGYVAVIAPWHIRNCDVFEGSFCGLATNGGSVAYRANNPRATGLWTGEGEVPLAHLPELEQNQLGYDLARRWIADHPLEFAVLSLKKLAFLLGADDHGAYWAIKRGGAEDAHDPRRLLAFQLADVISLGFWFAVCSLCFLACIKGFRLGLDRREALSGMLYPIFYCAAVFSVFESGSRHHMVAMPTLLVAATTVWFLPSLRTAIPRQRLP